MEHGDGTGLVMLCPSCGSGHAMPADRDGAVIAWYRCCACDAEWSARVRHGRPDSVIVIKPGRSAAG